MDAQVRADARVLWDYHRLGMPLAPGDAVIGLGSYDPAVADWCADLVLRGLAPRIVFTGAKPTRDDLLKSPWQRAEAEEFRDLAVTRGVPAAQILVEPRATNTGENLRFSLVLLRERALPHGRLILVTKPNMERRVRATAALQCPEAVCIVTSPPGTFDAYCFERFDSARMIALMVGDLQRIALYPAQGLQAPEPLPAKVREAYGRLVAAGYVRHLVRQDGAL